MKKLLCKILGHKKVYVGEKWTKFIGEPVLKSAFHGNPDLKGYSFFEGCYNVSDIYKCSRCDKEWYVKK